MSFFYCKPTFLILSDWFLGQLSVVDTMEDTCLNETAADILQVWYLYFWLIEKVGCFTTVWRYSYVICVTTLVHFWQVNALCAGVQDSSVLVQRSALDLLLVGFPMHNSHLVRSDMVRLVTSALATILRRDMSLNR